MPSEIKDIEAALEDAVAKLCEMICRCGAGIKENRDRLDAVEKRLAELEDYVGRSTQPKSPY